MSDTVIAFLIVTAAAIGVGHFHNSTDGWLVLCGGIMIIWLRHINDVREKEI